jgi:hypothetical protein
MVYLDRIFFNVAWDAIFLIPAFGSLPASAVQPMRFYA